MIIVADSGSTKTDWVILDKNLDEYFRTRTIGFNPYYISPEEINLELNRNEQLKNVGSDIQSVYFYGAGCSAEYLKENVKNGLTPLFQNAEIHIEHDLLAACYAAYRGKPAIVCILGTGSNACYFDGVNVREETPSLAYILGDEGSGNHIGRKLIHAYFSKKLPQDLHQKFDEKYHLTITELNKNVYQNNLANAYLASFSTFVHENRDHSYFQNMIYGCMKEFFINQVLPHPEARFSEVNFIGSVAHFYDEILHAVAAELHLEIGQIVQKPINSIVEYHKKYILTQ